MADRVRGARDAGTAPAVSPREVDPGRRAQSQQVRVVLHLRVAEPLADPLEVRVARDGQRAAQVDRAVARPHPAPALAVVGGLRRDHALGQARDRHDDLEHRAGLVRVDHARSVGFTTASTRPVRGSMATTAPALPPSALAPACRRRGPAPSALAGRMIELAGAAPCADGALRERRRARGHPRTGTGQRDRQQWPSGRESIRH